MKDSALDHILRTTSRIEALVHDYMIVTLADNSKAINCRMQSTDLNANEEDEMYVVAWEFKCLHVGNIS